MKAMLRTALSVLVMAFAAGCSSKTYTAIGNGYFVKDTKSESIMSEPGGLMIQFVYRLNRKETTIDYSGNYNGFSKKVYGSNLLYVTGYNPGALMLYSPKSGKIVVNDQLRRYSTVNADDTGVTLTAETDSSTNQIYSAEYLKSL